MSTTPRSSLKRRSGNLEDRHVSFATPLSSSEKATIQTPVPFKKQLSAVINNRATPSSTKKSKPADEMIDVISLVNEQSEVMEEVFDVEHKLIKQSKTTHDMISELTTFIERIAKSSFESILAKTHLEEQSAMISSLEKNITDLVSEANSTFTNFENRIHAKSQYTSKMKELQKTLRLVNCSKTDNSEMLKEIENEYDHLLGIIDELETYAGKI